MRVIGTAGHVDHGKSTLVHRLTGIDPDRLAEEKARALTIDLGFAWLTLPDGEILGIVDVPGHRDFIENMLAGVGGIDAALLVVAADEGVMPQTREHLAILDLLGIDAGLVALTRVDLVDDPEWLELAREEVQELLTGTGLAGAPVIPVSALTGYGLDDLLQQLVNLPGAQPERAEEGLPRLPVDRVFTMSGFGTVVTGSLSGGKLGIGDGIMLQPGDLRGRVRGLQSYQRKVDCAFPGSRVAVNISGVQKAAIARGHVLCKPGQLQNTLLADASFHYLSSAGRNLPHNAEVKFFSGTAEVGARIRLLEGDELSPGQDSWMQLRLARPVPLAHNDRYILRWPSPAATIGGGLILDPQPGRNWKRNQPQVLRRMQLLSEGSPAERLALAARGRRSWSHSQLMRAGGMSHAALDAALAEALQRNLLVALDGERWLAREDWGALQEELLANLAAFHREYPLRVGMPREALRSKLALDQGMLATLLAKTDGTFGEGDVVRLRGHAIQLTEQQENMVKQVLQILGENPYTPPSWSEVVNIAGEELPGVLLERGDVVRVSSELIFAAQAWQQLVQATLDIIERDGSVSASQLRDRFGTSRKYAIGVLEALDEARITRRDGDVRVRGPAPLPSPVTKARGKPLQPRR